MLVSSVLSWVAPPWGWVLAPGVGQGAQTLCLCQPDAVVPWAPRLVGSRTGGLQVQRCAKGFDSGSGVLPGIRHSCDCQRVQSRIHAGLEHHNVGRNDDHEVHEEVGKAEK